MSDVRIKTNALCIENYCNERLFRHDDSKEIRDVFRQILAHTKEIIRVDETAAKMEAEYLADSAGGE